MERIQEPSPPSGHAQIGCHALRAWRVDCETQARSLCLPVCEVDIGSGGKGVHYTARFFNGHEMKQKEQDEFRKENKKPMPERSLLYIYEFKYINV